MHSLHRPISLCRNFAVRKSVSNQSTLEEIIRSLFKNEEIQVNARKSTGLRNKIASELDVFIPNLKLAFEFQDKYHYFTDWRSQLTIDEVRRRDEQKRIQAQQAGLTLIEIPFWWDGSKESLIATIHKDRPDLLQDFRISPDTNVIPKIPPKDIVKKMEQHIEGFGEVEQASFYDTTFDPTNWLLFEKYDGIRAFWDSDKCQFLSRTGKILRIPESIISRMPTCRLEGELWFGRGKFHEAQKIATRADPSSIDWSQLKFMVFDLPEETSSSSSKMMYKDRYAKLQEMFSPESPHPIVHLAEAVTCRSAEHVIEFASSIIEEKGGEGVIIRNPLSTYHHGKSKNFLKFKIYRDDEARLMEQLENELWRCELPNGATFEAPIETKLKKDTQQRTLLQPGAIVSFKYTRYNRDRTKPLAASIYRVRTDIDWNQVSSNFRYQTVKRGGISSTINLANNNNSRKDKQKKHEMGYWGDRKNRKAFFDDLATERHEDPRNATFWYKLTRKEVLRRKGGSGLLNYHRGSMKEALLDAYPDIVWDLFKFRKRDYWTAPENCRKFFDEFAQETSMEQPQRPDNWYRVHPKDILQKQGGGSILEHFHSLPAALQAAYPDLLFDTSKFPQRSTHKETKSLL